MRSDQGISRLARDTASDLSRLVRLEAQLAAEQIKGQVGKKLVSAGAGGTGALMLVFGLLFALAGAAAAIAIVLPVWAALLIVAGGSVLAGAMLGGIAVAGFKSGGGVVPESTKRRLREDVQWLREQSS
jgi:hypothetical protein